MKNILIVEDESIVALEIQQYVQSLGYTVVSTVSNAVECLHYINSEKIDLILMDVYIKGDVDGIECASEIKSLHDIPLIYITAFSDEETLERAVATNPSAYLVKPFNRNELKVALKIGLKRVKNAEYRGDLVFDDEFSFDTERDELVMNSEVLHLTKNELKLLHLFIERKNSVISLYELENEIWPDKEINENTRRALISRLRAKLNYRFIETIHPVGYKFHI